MFPEIGPNAKRDAIHFPIVPVQAEYTVRPGEMVDKNGHPSDDGPYMVNPWHFGYPDDIRVGEWFWMILPPGIVGDVRHDWFHEDFAEPSTNEESVNWLKEFCANTGIPYSHLVGEDSEDEWIGVKIGTDVIYVGGTDACGDIPDEFWVHYKNVTGHDPGVRPTYIRCSC